MRNTFSRLARQGVRQSTTKQTSLLQAISDTGGVREVPAGRAGMIVPTGIATDSSTSAFFGHLVSKKRLNGLFDFENKEGIFLVYIAVSSFRFYQWSIFIC